MNNNKVGIICQARLSSSRLPGKVLYDLGGINSIELMCKRYRRKLNDKYNFIIATSNNSEDIAIKNFCEEKKINYFCGSLENVLERYFKCAQINNYQFIVRVTSDCPFLDFTLIPKMLENLVENNLDYLSNNHNQAGHVPDGFDIEIFKMSSLKKVMELKDLLPSEIEHVTFAFLNRKIFKKFLLKDTPKRYGDIRVTLDEPADLKLIRKLINLIGTKNIINYSMSEICEFILENNLSKINSKIEKNNGWKSAFKKDIDFLENKKI